MPLSDDALDLHLAGRPPADIPTCLPEGFAPTWRSGVHLSPAAAQWLLGRLLHQSELGEAVEVERLRARIESTSVGDWMDEVSALPGAYAQRFSELAWLYASLGQEKHLRGITASVDMLWRHHRTLPLEVLRRNGTDGAVRQLAEILHSAWHRKLGRAALEHLQRVAEDRALHLWELLRDTDAEPRPPQTGGEFIPLSAHRDAPFAQRVADSAPIEPRTLHRTLRKLGYRPMAVEEAGMVYHHARLVFGHLLHLHHQGLAVKGGGGAEPVALREVHVTRFPEPKERSWKKVPSVVIEAMHMDLHALLEKKSEK